MSGALCLRAQISKLDRAKAGEGRHGGLACFYQVKMQMSKIGGQRGTEEDEHERVQPSTSEHIWTP